MRETGTLIVLVIIYCPIIMYIKKIQKRFLLIIFSVLLFPIIYLIIWFIFPYYHLAPFEGKVIDALTKEPIPGVRIIAEYTTSSPSVAGEITRTVDSQEDYTDQDGEFRILEVSRWFGDKNGNPKGHINANKSGYAHFPSFLSHAVGFMPYEPPSDKYLVIELKPITIDSMIQTLYSEKENTRFQAASELLVNFSPIQTVGPLLEALEKGNSYARATAAYTLARVLRYRGANKFRIAVIGALIVSTKDENTSVRYRAVDALSEIKDPQAVDALISALNDNEPVVRQSAAKALGDLKDPIAVEALILATKDENPDVKWNAIRALGEFKDMRTTARLTEELQNKNSVARLSAIEALVKAPDSHGISALIATLEDDDRLVKRNAARALGRIKAYQAVEPLIALLEDQGNDSYSRENAAWALGQIKDPHSIASLTRSVKDKDSRVRSMSLHALAYIKDPRGFSPIISSLEDADRNVRRSAVVALGNIGEPCVVEPLISALNDEDRIVREHATRALGTTKDPRAIEPLIKALGDSDGAVRSYAERALREITKQNFREDRTHWRDWFEKYKRQETNALDKTR